MKITFLSLMLILVISCKRNIVSSHKVDERLMENDSNDFFMLNEYDSMDTLYLDIVLADCGEWGGPQEKYKIYEEGKGYKLDYKKYKYICDSLDKYYGKNPVIEKKQSLHLTGTETWLISDFFIELMNEKVGKNLITSHAGNVFVLHDRDSTLFLHAYTDSKRIKNKYLELRSRLGLSK